MHTQSAAPTLYGPGGEPLNEPVRACAVCLCNDHHACTAAGTEEDPVPCWRPIDGLDVCSACLILLGAQKWAEDSHAWLDAVAAQRLLDARRAA